MELGLEWMEPLIMEPPPLVLQSLVSELKAQGGLAQNKRQCCATIRFSAIFTSWQDSVQFQGKVNRKHKPPTNRALSRRVERHGRAQSVVGGGQCQGDTNFAVKGGGRRDCHKATERLRRGAFYFTARN